MVVRSQYQKHYTVYSNRGQPCQYNPLKVKLFYIPPLWIMCLEAVAHLLIIFNVSSNFLIYCSVSNQFKASLSKLCIFFCKRVPEGNEGNSQLTYLYVLIFLTVINIQPSLKLESSMITHNMV